MIENPADVEADVLPLSEIIHGDVIIRSLGPLIHLSSIRYEAFHKIAKSNAHVATSRVNIPYTLALKHQLILSHRLLLNDGLYDNVTVGLTVFLENSKLPVELVSFLARDNQKWTLVKWIKTNGITYL